MLRRVFELVLNLLYPPRCVGCGSRDSMLCAACCPQPLPESQRVQALAADAPLMRAQGIYAFTGTVRLAIHGLKYHKHQRLAVPLAALVVPYLPWEPHVLVPVPAHASRLRERGFNQAALLAHQLGSAWQLPVLDQLQRTRATEQQVGRSLPERAANVLHAFEWQGPAPPARVLLIDDVLTTGATLAACAAAVLKAGAAEVQGLAVARTLK